MSADATTSGGELVQEYGTGYLRTRIIAHSRGRYAWQRQPGPDRGSLLVQGSPEFRQKANASARGRVRFAMSLPRVAADNALTYITSGQRALAGLLSSVADTPHQDQLLSTVTDCGRVLRALHQHPHEDAVSAPLSGPARLQAWMNTATGTRAATALHSRMYQFLGSARWETIAQWCDAALHDPVDTAVTLHGAFGLGQIVMADHPEAGAVVLAGEDATRGAASFDVGWLLGELAEFHILAQRAGVPRPLLGEARASFLAGYGNLADPTAVAHTAVLRIAVHTHDFSAFVGWHPELLLYIRYIAELIDDEGASTLAAW
ncbi:phosphotransferase [Streptomyces sp. NPDC006649]|uniref:phosphotransferase n=1 Tax=Streptomyces sp. NPDC006649 TaxID=3156896 RepID=UPI0033A71155